MVGLRPTGQTSVSKDYPFLTTFFATYIIGLLIDRNKLLRKKKPLSKERGRAQKAPSNLAPIGYSPTSFSMNSPCSFCSFKVQESVAEVSNQTAPDLRNT